MSDAMVSSMILCFMMYPFIFLMYFLIKNDATPKQKLWFGVTLDREQQAEINVKSVQEEYNKQMKHTLWFMLLFPLPMFLIPWFSVALTYWMVWILLSVFVFFVPFAKANKKLKERKKEKGWNTAAVQEVYAEMKQAGEIRRVKWYHFLPPTLIGIGIAMISVMTDGMKGGEALSVMEITFAVVVLLFWGLAVRMDKQRTQIISSDSDVNVNYSRAKKQLFGNFWLIMTWMHIVCMAGMLFAVDRNGLFTNWFWICMTVYFVLTIIGLVWILRKKIALDKTYEIHMDYEEDDDQHWIWGMVYYNPKDKHSMVDKRVGVGTTVNMATPVGKGFAAAGILGLLSLPMIGIWIMMLEFTPICLKVENGQIIARHLKTDYVISVIRIDEAKLLDELPKMSRNQGTAMDRLKKGSYHIKEQGNCEVFLNPQNSVFLMIETSDELYYFSGSTDAETEKVYEYLQNRSDENK